MGASKSAEKSLGEAASKCGKSGLLIVVSGPSGVGKGTILAEAAKRLPELRLSISVTSRAPRANEVDGEDYFFRSPEEFEEMKKRGEFLEWARYLDHLYGTPRKWVEEHLSAGEDIALEIDVQGGKQVRKSFPRAVLVFVAPPSEAALRTRLLGRKTESEEMLDRRVEAYREESKAISVYDYVIVNDALSEAVDLFYCIVRAEKARIKRMCPNEQ